MDYYQKYLLYKNKYLNLKAGAQNPKPDCDTYHGKPFKCLSTPGCDYFSETEQCSKKQSLPPRKAESDEDYQARNLRAWQTLKTDKYINDPFYRDKAGETIARQSGRVRQGLARRKEARETIARQSGRLLEGVRRRKETILNEAKRITFVPSGVGEIPPFECINKTPIMDVLKHIRDYEVGSDITTIGLVLEDTLKNLPADQEPAEEHLFTAANRDELVMTISNSVNITLYVVLIDSDHTKLENLTRDLPEGTNVITEWLENNILQLLYLSENNLTGLPDSIGNLRNLQTLYLSNNRLTRLPDSIGNLRNLQTLYLSNNRLTSLPDSIGNLRNLQTLHLSYNGLTSLPDSIGDLRNLQTLYLGDNGLTSLPDSFYNLRNLQLLHLSENNLTSLPDSIGNLRNLQDIICIIQWINEFTR